MDNKIQIQPDTTRVLMSDTLKGQVPELEKEDDLSLGIEESIITVVIERVIVGTSVQPIVGVLYSFQSGVKPELEIKLSTDEAFKLVQTFFKQDAEPVSFISVQLHKDEDVVTVPGPFVVADVRLSDVDPRHGMCVMAMKLAFSKTT